LLWNLYRRQTTPRSKKTSFLFGLYQSQSGMDGKGLRLFYIPLLKPHSAPPAPKPGVESGQGATASPLASGQGTGPARPGSIRDLSFGPIEAK
jgi:hypothetical protein